MKRYINRRERPKAFIGAAISAGVGLAKGISGGIKARKQRQAQEQQNYINAMLASKSSLDTEAAAMEGLADQFEDKYVARCGGRRKASLGLLQAPSMSVSPKTVDTTVLNKDLQSFNSGVGINNASLMDKTGALLKGGAGSSIGGAVGNALGGIAGKLIAGGPARNIEASNIQVRTKPLTNINVGNTNDVNVASGEYGAKPMGVVAKYGSRKKFAYLRAR